MPAKHLQDARELVRIAEPLQQHILVDMGDHLVTLGTILGDIADSRFDATSSWPRRASA